MGVYKNAGYTYLITGIVSIIFSIAPLMILLTPTYSGLIFWFQVFVFLGAVLFILYLLLGAFTWPLASETDNSTLKIGAIFVIITSLILLGSVVTFFGALATGSLEALLGSFGLLMIFFVFALITYIILGVGLRGLGDSLGNSNIKTGGLLVILGIILGVLAAIGFIIVGVELIKQE